MINTLENWFLWFMFYSIFGWIYECIVCSVSERKLINRGFLNGPYCPIYGCGAVLDLLILGRLTNPAVIFFAGIAVNCSLEYFTGWGMEKLFHAKWWDYSNYRFNIKGRVCLLGAVVFGTFAAILIKIVHPFTVSLFARFSPNALHILTAMLFVMFVTDITVTLIGFAGFSSKLRSFSAELKRGREKALEFAAAYRGTLTEKLRDTDNRFPSVSALHAKFFKKTNLQERRILKSFPKLKSLIDDEVLSELRKRLHK